MNPRVRTATEPGLIAYVTLRQGEEGAPDNLTIRIGPGRRPRLHYRDRAPEDRDVRGVLWGRCSQNRSPLLVPHGMPSARGTPRCHLRNQRPHTARTSQSAARAPRRAGRPLL
jgi:hypothetical protein